MNDKQISHQLALAIGWKPDQIDASPVDAIFVLTEMATLHSYAQWRRFDYRDPTVIWPIAERYDAFPSKSQGLSGEWWPRGVVRGKCTHHIGICETAAKAVAIAVIGGAS